MQLVNANALMRKPKPIYGDMEQICHWLYVEVQTETLYSGATKARFCENYNIGGNYEECKP